MNSLTSLANNRSVLALLVTMVLLSFAALILEGLSLRKKKPYFWLLSVPAVFLMALLVVILAPVEPSTFIYFNF